MCSTVNERRQGPANALMNLPRHIILLGRGIEVESTDIVPILHDRQPIEQQGVPLLGDVAHHIGVGRYVEHRSGARAVLHVHQNDIGAGRRKPFNGGANMNAGVGMPALMKCHLTDYR